MAKFSDLLPLVRIEVPSCPDPLTENHLVRAARELCRRSKVWNITGSFSPFSGISDYRVSDYIDMPTDSEVDMVTGATQNNTPLSRLEIVDINNNQPGWKAETGKFANAYIMENRRNMLLHPTPDAAAVDLISIHVSLRPTITASTMDDDLYEDWGESIAYGALASLMSISGKQWSNAEEAQKKREQFNYWVNKAVLDSVRGYGDMDIIVRSD